ncbi:MAG TPA: hypothetical protein VJN18_15690 [Polyangiaceae bacterium]|nr:hypothetical protein [Polyangiaceae bacterium]
MRPLAPVEAALAFSLVGSLLALTIPAFLRNLHASKMSEALVGLERISARAVSLADGAPQTSAYPASAPLTPESVPRATLVSDPPGTWNHPTWRLLGFGLEVPHAYSFRFDAENGPEVSRFTATAHGDLDGDGVLSTFQISGTVRPAQPPERGVLEVSREVE